MAAAPPQSGTNTTNILALTGKQFVSKIAFVYTGMFNFTNNGTNSIKIKIGRQSDGTGAQEFYLGKTGILELQDTEIRYIAFPNGLPNYDSNKGYDPYMTIDLQIAIEGE